MTIFKKLKFEQFEGYFMRIFVASSLTYKSNCNFKMNGQPVYSGPTRIETRIINGVPTQCVVQDHLVATPTPHPGRTTVFNAAPLGPSPVAFIPAQPVAFVAPGPVGPTWIVNMGIRQNYS